MKFAKNVLELVGDTPLVRLNRVAPEKGATVLVKCEFLNPAGSIKDRMALHILEKAERSGRLRRGATIVENTSGNTGAAVAMAAAVKGYRCIFTMPDKMSQEKIDLLKAYGAQVVVTPTNVPADSPLSYYETAKRIAKETPGSFYLNQYHNPDNIEAHYRSTGPEIFEQTGGRLDVFVAGIGTGGTMSGAGRYLKEKSRKIRNVAVDPEGSVYAGYFKTGKLPPAHVYKVEGIGEDMLCKAMDFSVVDDVVTVDDRQCFQMARRLSREEGLFAGGSSGAAAHVACEVARRLPRGKIVVAVLPDSGSRYLSKFFNDGWMRDHGFAGAEARRGTVAELLRSRRQRLVVARHADRVDQVTLKMKRFGISQMPVVDAQGKAVGMVHEVDLLNAMLKGRHVWKKRVEGLMAPLQGAVRPTDPLSRLSEILAQDNVAVVVDEGKPLALVARIDWIDHLGHAGH